MLDSATQTTETIYIQAEVPSGSKVVKEVVFALCDTSSNVLSAKSAAVAVVTWQVGETATVNLMQKAADFFQVSPANSEAACNTPQVEYYTDAALTTPWASSQVFQGLGGSGFNPTAAAVTTTTSVLEEVYVKA